MATTLLTIAFGVGCIVAVVYLAWRFFSAFSKVGP